jgi:hypothetical protein
VKPEAPDAGSKSPRTGLGAEAVVARNHVLRNATSSSRHLCEAGFDRCLIIFGGQNIPPSYSQCVSWLRGIGREAELRRKKQLGGYERRHYLYADRPSRVR